MKIFYLLSVLCLLTCPVMGQKNSAAKANKTKADHYFAAYDFAAAAKAYEKELAAEPAEATLMVKLVQCYLRLNNKSRAQYWLDKAMLAPLADARHYKELAGLLAMNARHREAALLYEKAAALNDAEASKWQQAYKDLGAFYKDSLLYKVSKASFNSAYSDFSPAFYGAGIVFSSSRSNHDKANQLNKNYTGFIDLFYSRGEAAEPVAFSADLNSRYHEGPLAFVPSQDTVYFTRSNFQQKSVFSKAGVNHLKIYFAVRQKDRWQKVQALPLNNDEYSVGHPALAGSNTLYFASDMPGGYGGTDLYKSVKVNGTWQAPVNLGPEINTSGNELFPFVEENGTLYFASNGHPGLGGLDIFYAPRKAGGFALVKHLGYPLNSPGDDFGLIVKGDSGYYSSNYRSAHDDIYAFKLARQKQVILLAVDKAGKPLTNVQLEVNSGNGPVQKIAFASLPAAVSWPYAEATTMTLKQQGRTVGQISLSKADFSRYQHLDTLRIAGPAAAKPVQVVLRDEEGNAVSGAKVELWEADSGKRQVYMATGQGAVPLMLIPGKRYKLRGTKPGYHEWVQEFDGPQAQGDLPQQQLALKLKKELFPTGRVGEAIDLAIEYDLDKADIRPDAALILGKMVDYMQDHPGVKVELSAHTDSRGENAYNQALSQRRAESAVAYALARGIAANRMVARGFGESRLKIVRATTEAQHQANRRTTVKITANTDPALAASGPKSYLVAERSARYFVVMGGFSNIQAARKLRKELLGKSPDSKVILPYAQSKLFRVSIADFADKEEALHALPGLKKRFGDSLWILNY